MIDNILFKKSGRREFFQECGKASLVIGGGLTFKILLNGCTHFTIKEERPVIYPHVGRPDQNKIQPPDNGCYIGFHSTSPHDHIRGGYGWLKMKIGMGPLIMFPPFREMSPVVVRQHKTFTTEVNVPEKLIMHDIAYTFLYRDIAYDLTGIHFSQLADDRSFREKIEIYAKNITKIKRPIFFSTMWEMNISSWPWRDDPQSVKKTWKTMHKIFDDHGANNYTTWVFVPYVIGDPSWHHEDPIYYYPGDEFVDWLGLSGYNRTGFHARDISFRELASSTIASLQRISKDKPVMIAEMGRTKDIGQPNWVKNAYSWIRRQPVIKAACYWDSIDLELEDDHTLSEYSFKVLQEIFKDPYFIGIRE